ncbi:hypothetical protein Goshw_019077 [Gossypium schwendimanii]|uniref:Oxysterol-binding protein n=1 Tax=Gossypium schwendimanii TaxID=34291 RepID=A0A7J9NEK3_GOSSC|nr:hypothetical protein [Gossypium schwendimanii]
MTSGLSLFGNAMHRSVNGLLGYEGVEVINPEGGKEDAEEEAHRGRWKQEERESYWKMMHKYIGSDVTSMVTLPVLIFEPMTMLQKMAELMEYSYLLDQADECEDPYLRLVYASSWAISVYYAYQRTWKPFNPIIGETYELANHEGITFISEQVSHHPPMSAGHAENEHFTYDVTSKLKTKFLGNSLDVYPVGRTRVALKRDGVVLDLVPPPTKVNNLIFGRTWVDSPGEMIMTNLTTGDKVVLYFQPCGWFGAGRYEVDGYVYNAAEEPKILMTGKWNESMSYQPCDMEGEPRQGTELKEVWHVADTPKNDKFQFTYFAHKINSFDTAPKKLLASDSRLRPDRFALEKGDLSKAGSEKSRSLFSLSLSLTHTHTHTKKKKMLNSFLHTSKMSTSEMELKGLLEERQRAEKRTREAKGHQFTPRWFDLTDEISATPWGDLEIYRFNGKYTEHRATVDSSDGIDEVDLAAIEFNPWQYGNLSTE